MVNRKRKSLVTIVLVVSLMLSSISMVFAALETFLVQGNDGSYYEYNSSDLDMSYLSYQINPNLPGASMYKHFLNVGGKVVGVKDSEKGYMDFQAAQDASLMAQIKGQVFKINDYLATDKAKVLGGDITGIKEVDKEGNVIEPGGLPKATVKFYASLVPGMKTIMVTLDTETPLDYTVTYNGLELTYDESFGSFKAEVSTAVSETLKPVITKSGLPEATTQFFSSLTPGKIAILVTLDTESPLDYTVSYAGVELAYNAALGGFTGELDAGVSETLVPVVAKI